MSNPSRPLAVVTGASTGIGFELAKCCAQSEFDLLLVADEPSIESAAHDIGRIGVAIEAIEADLSKFDGVDALYAKIAGRPVAALLANAGRGLGNGFLDQDFAGIMRVVNTNITGTLYLLHKVGRDMRQRGDGRILITGSIAGFMPGTYQAVYNGTKAFLDSFAIALRAELQGSGVTVSCLMPGATETRFFERAGMLDTQVGKSEQDDPADVAKAGFRAMMNGDSEVVSGWGNKMRVAVASITPSEMLAEQHRKFAQPGPAHHS